MTVNHKSMALRVGVVACFLLLSLTALPVRASEDPGQAAALASREEMSSEIAARVEARARFAAEVGPRLAEVVRVDQRLRMEFQGSLDHLVGIFWMLRSRPAMQREWLDNLESRDSGTRDRQIGHLRSFVHQIPTLMRLATPESFERLAAIPTSWGRYTDEMALAMTALSLEADRLADAALGPVLDLYQALSQNDISGYDLDRHAEEIRAVVRQPESMPLLIEILSRKDLGTQKRKALLIKLAKDPEAVRDQLQNAEEHKAAVARYEYAATVEGYTDVVLLPLSEILPKAHAAVEKSGTLSIDGKKPDSRSLVMGTFPWPSGHSAKAAPEEGRQLLFQPEERLYLVTHRGWGRQIFADSLLDPLADSGPTVMEFSPDDVSALFRDTGPAQSFHRPYLLASAASAEEVAAHLASLSVVHGEREKSLYGSIEDFDGHGRWHDNSVPPRDAPGKGIRLVNLQDPAFFLALAPLADQAGLARLMGPIRAVAAVPYGAAETSLTILRYAPGRTETKVHVLGQSPLLAVEKTALEALAAAREEAFVNSWAVYEMMAKYKDDKALSGPLWAEKFAEVRRRFGELEVKGVRSPMDKGRMLYYLQQYTKPEDLAQKLRVVADDAGISSKQRLEAMHKIVEEYKKAKP